MADALMYYFPERGCLSMKIHLFFSNVSGSRYTIIRLPFPTWSIFFQYMLIEAKRGQRQHERNFSFDDVVYFFFDGARAEIRIGARLLLRVTFVWSTYVLRKRFFFLAPECLPTYRLVIMAKRMDGTFDTTTSLPRPKGATTMDTWRVLRETLHDPCDRINGTSIN